MLMHDLIVHRPCTLRVYHSWNEERARWYGQRVLSIYRNILHELEVRQ